LALAVRDKGTKDHSIKTPVISAALTHSSSPAVTSLDAQVPAGTGLPQLRGPRASAQPDLNDCAGVEKDSSTLLPSRHEMVALPEQQAGTAADEPHSQPSSLSHQQPQGEAAKDAAKPTDVDLRVDFGGHPLAARHDALPPLDSESSASLNATQHDGMPSPKVPMKPASRPTAPLPATLPLSAHSLSQPAGELPREATASASANTVAERIAQPSQASARPADQDTFAALDNAASPASTWIHTSAHHAEAGYLDPSLGWVSVRADAGAGGMHAAIVPGSALAASTLGDHLAGLNAFLAEHKHPATVTLAPEAPSSDPGGSPLGNDLNGQGNHRQPDRNAAHETRSSLPLPGENERNATRSVSPQPAAALPTGNGVYLSVLA
jgi:hypothetical protein